MENKVNYSAVVTTGGRCCHSCIWLSIDVTICLSGMWSIQDRLATRGESSDYKCLFYFFSFFQFRLDFWITVRSMEIFNLWITSSWNKTETSFLTSVHLYAGCNFEARPTFELSLNESLPQMQRPRESLQDHILYMCPYVCVSQLVSQHVCVCSCSNSWTHADMLTC